MYSYKSSEKTTYISEEIPKDKKALIEQFEVYKRDLKALKQEQIYYKKLIQPTMQKLTKARIQYEEMLEKANKIEMRIALLDLKPVKKKKTTKSKGTKALKTAINLLNSLSEEDLKVLVANIKKEAKNI